MGTNLVTTASRLKQNIRKERNGQLIALGIFMENYLRKATPKSKENIWKRIHQCLSGRNLERALAAFKRISDEMASGKEEISPEPPSQLPAADATEKSQGSA